MSVSPGRHCDADASETEDQFIPLLSAGETHAFTHRIADVAEHEQVSDRRAGKRGAVFRFPGDKAAGEALQRAPRRGGLLVGTLDTVRQRRIERQVPLAPEIEETLREIGVVGRERRIDFPRRDRGIERARNGVIGNRDRIVLCGEQRYGFKGLRPDGECGERQGYCHAARHRDPQRSHRILLPAPLSMSLTAGAPARCRLAKLDHLVLRPHDRKDRVWAGE